MNKTIRNISSLILTLASTVAAAEMINTKVSYTIGKTAFEGVLVYDNSVKTPRPGLVLVPNWMGINPANLKQAELVANNKYVVFVADLFGKTIRPKNAEEAGKAAGAVKGDRKLMRERMNKAMEQLTQSVKTTNVDVKKVGALGFCFGGTGALELARSGAGVAGVVSFHGGLGSPTPDDAKNVKAKVLALHGADDPFVPADEVKAFEDEMRKAGVDWQLVAFGNAVHSFTDPDAHAVGQANYNPLVAARAYAMMNTFFDEAFATR